MIFKFKTRIVQPFYVRFNDAKVAKTDEVGDGLLVDYGADGKVVGIEILHGTLERFERSGLDSRTTAPTRGVFVNR